jgi:hypothetical protein
MNPGRLNAGRFPRMLWIAAAAALVIWLALAWQPVPTLVARFNGDDAYYYLTIARHIAAGQGASFDGIAATNGFHPLYLMLIVPFFWMFPTDGELVVQGQAAIMMLGLFALLRSASAGGIALAFMVLKPQLVLLLAPWMLWQWWRRDRRQIVWFLVVICGLLIASFIVQPDWVARFFARSGGHTRAAISSSLRGLLAFLPASIWLPSVAFVAAIAVVWAWRKNDFDIVAAVGLLVSPFIFSYNLLPLLALLCR